jgi:Family of unknown function (DUF6535)
VTAPELKPNPQDKSAFYLENIYKLQFLSDSNVSRPSIAVTPANPPPFSPSNYIVWVNSLWFLSLTISLTCAMLVSMLQQWARRYLWITQRARWNPHDEARMRAFFAHGVEKFRFSSVAEAIPSLIHISLFLFFAGLLIYLFNINHTAFLAVVWWIGVSTVAYLVITILPLLQVDSPYYSPLSSLVFRVCGGLLYLAFFSKRLRNLAPKYSIGFSRGFEKIAREEITKISRKVDRFILKSTFDAHVFASDDQLDHFFECIHGFYNSQIIRDPLRILATLDSRKFSSAMVAFLNRTMSSSLVTESDKIQRFIMCLKIADETQGTALRDLFFEAANHSFVRTVEVGHILRSPNELGEEIGLRAQTIVADIIANADKSDDRWTTLAANQLGKSEDNIRRYLAHGDDSVLLANTIHMARQIWKFSSRINRSIVSDAASCILEPPLKFDIRKALPELQHDFCSLWNEIVPEAQKSGDGSVLHLIVFLLLGLYTDLHQDTDPPAFSIHKFSVSTYPLCSRPDHRNGDSSSSSLIPAQTRSHPLYLSPPSDYVSDAPTATITGPPTASFDAPSSAVVLPVPSSQPTGDLHSSADDPE